MGGGDLSANPTELNTISNCNNSNQECNIDTTYQNQSIQNHNSLSLQKIKIETQLLDFINYNALTLTEYITINSSGNSVKNFINYGTITTTSKYSLDTTNTATGGFMNIYNYGHISGYVYIAGGESSDTHIHNYGVMGGAIKAGSGNQTIYVNNLGTINLCETNGGNGCTKKAHFKNVNLVLHNYAMQINVDSATFNAFSGNASDNSHLVLDSVNSVSFADKNSKLILDFGDSFEFGAGYLFNKLVVDTSGNNALGVDLSRLIPRSDIYLISQSGDKFVVKLAPQHSIIGNLYKANVRTMNNFTTMSNAIIYPYKFAKRQVVKKKRVIRRVKKVSSLRDSTQSVESWQSTDSLESLQSNESFAYKNNLNNSSDSTTYTNPIRIANINEKNQRETRRRIKATNQMNRNANQIKSTIPSAQATTTNNNYYFVLTPFINHNIFFESGRYNLSGFDYGFLTAFSGKLTQSNALGAHFMMSYGSLNDSKDKDFMIKTLNLNLGINYKLDMIFDMYIKARGDFFYFLNQAKTLTMFEAIKPNNLGFGASVAYGKDFDFKQGGMLGIEAGLDYKALKTNEVVLNSQTYKQSLLNLIYADFGVSYAKYFGGFGINLGGGFRANLAPKLAKSALLINTQTLKFALDNDKYLGYANAGVSYALNAKSFDIEFSLAYYGNFGDRAISNAGGFEWRVLF